MINDEAKGDNEGKTRLTASTFLGNRLKTVQEFAPFFPWRNIPTFCSVGRLPIRALRVVCHAAVTPRSGVIH